MKNILYTLLLSIMIVGCDDRLADLNTDKKNPASVESKTLFARASKEIMDNMARTDVNDNPFRLYSQMWAQTTYPDESQYNMTTREIPYYFFINQYRDVLVDLKIAKDALTAKVDDDTDPTSNKEVLKNQLAAVNIIMAYTYSTLVDVFGDVPYTEALQADKYSFPKYDDAATIYTALIANLTASATNLKTNAAEGLGEYQEYDLIYNGSASGWAKFANSLKLRLALHIADVDATSSKKWANEAMVAGVFTSNTDNCAMTYQASSPNTNPVNEALVLSGRHDYVSANTLLDYMNSLNDGRRQVYFAQNVVTDDDGKDIGDVGGKYGEANTYGGAIQIGAAMHNPMMPGILMGYAEVEFLMAEMVERGGYMVTGTAESHYNAGITASFAEWQALDNTYGKGGRTLDATAYLAQADIAYSTAPGTWKQKLGTQMWLALYNQGLEAWTTWRRLDFTGFKIPPEVTAIPTRMTYPLREKNLNTDSYTAAQAKVTGGDTQTGKIFWDTK